MSSFPAFLAATEGLHLPTQECSAFAASRLMALVVSLELHYSCPELSRHRPQLSLDRWSRWFPLHLRARAAGQTSFANVLVTSSRARQPALRVRPGCLVPHRRQWSCLAGEMMARSSKRGFGERRRQGYEVGDSTERFSKGLPLVRDVDALYIWE